MVISIVLALALAAPGLGAAKARPDLVVASVSKPPASIERTGGFDLTVKVKNAGRAAARVSAAGIYLSTTKRKSRRSIPLRPTVGVPKLRGRRAYLGLVTVTVPASAAKARYYLIACADAGRKVRERRESNNCRTASGRIRVTAAIQPTPGKTSSELIDAAVKSGKISPSLGTAYKIFAAFGDPRLPSEYRGAAPPSSEAVLQDAAAKFDSLTPSAQDLIRPYFVGPFHAGSWWARTNGAAAPQARSFQVIGDRFIFRCGLTAPLSRWGHVDTANGKARVWWDTNRPADAEKAKTIAGAIDQPIWTKLFDVMKKEPISDDGDSTPCRGGDDRLDVALVDMPNERWEGVTTPLDLGCSETATVILIKSNTEHLLATVTHELMHAFQRAFKFPSCDEYRWLREATATWAADYVYPDDQSEQDFAPAFLAHPSRPLEYDGDDLHKYGAYLFPFYLSRVLGNPSLIGKIWANAADKNSLEAIDASIPGGFKGQWHNFVLSNWNKPPVDTYQKLDKLQKFPATSTPDGTENDADILVEVKAGGNVDYKITGSIDHLSARYIDFEFQNQTARSIDFYDGFSGGDPTLKVRALVKTQGQDWTVEDWSGKPQSFCRDLKNERLEELVLIFSNSNFKDRSTAAPLGPTELSASNIGCWQWAGSVKAEAKYVDDSAGFNQSETATATGVLFRRLERHGFGSTDFFVPVSGNVTWSHSGTFKTDYKSCSGQLDASYVIPVSSDVGNGAIELAGFVGSDLPPTILNRQYSGGLPAPWEFSGDYTGPSVTYDCSDGSQEFFGAFLGALWLTRQPPEGPAPAVSADGMHLDGTYTYTSGVYSVKYTWHFTSVPQS